MNHNRRSIRLQGYDYSQAGTYVVTICTHNRDDLFGEIANGEMHLNYGGQMVELVWGELQVRFDHIELDEFVVMPNHIHGIFVLRRSLRGESCIRPVSTGDQTSGDHKDRPYGTLPNTVGRIIQAFKSITTHKYITGVKQYGWPPFPGKLWQRNYYEHIIRNEDELKRIREYIINNPVQWDIDRENPAAAVTGQIGVGGDP